MITLGAQRHATRAAKEAHSRAASLGIIIAINKHAARPTVLVSVVIATPKALALHDGWCSGYACAVASHALRHVVRIPENGFNAHSSIVTR